jgi:hypothetical protein
MTYVVEVAFGGPVTMAAPAASGRALAVARTAAARSAPVVLFVIVCNKR